VLIELVGCSGAGKTTIGDLTVGALRAKGFSAISSADIFRERSTIGWIKDNSLRNLALSFMLIPRFMEVRKSRKEYLRFAARMIWKYEKWPLGRINRIRSVMRVMGEDSVLRDLPKKEVVVIDEGMVGSAHSVLVYMDRFPNLKEIGEFVRLVPLPDLVVFVDVPASVALKRTLRRPDRPIRGGSAFELAGFVDSGCEIFRHISAHGRLGGVLLKVENESEVMDEMDNIVSVVTRFVEERFRNVGGNTRMVNFSAS
jgi:thymidylate kinase